MEIKDKFPDEEFSTIRYCPEGLTLEQSLTELKKTIQDFMDMLESDSQRIQKEIEYLNEIEKKLKGFQSDVQSLKD